MGCRAGDFGLLSDLELRVLRLRSTGLGLTATARRLGVSKQAVWAAERRARRVVELAEKTLAAYRVATSLAAVLLEPGVHVEDAARALVSEADSAGVRLVYSFPGLLELLRGELKRCLEGDRVKGEALVVVDGGGRVYVYCGEAASKLAGYAGRLVRLEAVRTA